MIKQITITIDEEDTTPDFEGAVDKLVADVEDLISYFEIEHDVYIEMETV